MKFLYQFFCFLLTMPVASAQPLPGLVPYSDGRMWGYADTTGRVVISPRWPEVAFFIGGRAVVVCGDTKAEGKTYCSIDQAGNYIIPPGRRWQHRISYSAGGVERYMLNSRDSNGRWGLIDSNNNLVISYGWDAPIPPYDQEMQDSLMVVSREGYKGVIDFTGREVLPCRYAEVRVVHRLYRSMQAFIVADADNTHGMNKWGVAAAGGKTVLQMRYSNIDFTDAPEAGFKVGVMPADGRAQGQAIERFVSYPSMASRPFKPGQPGMQPELHLGKYILQGIPGNYTLLDTARKTVLDRIAEVHGDTLVQIKYDQRSDSLIQTMFYFGLAGLKLKDSLKKITYHSPPDYGHRSYVCGTGAKMAAQSRSYEWSAPRIPGYGERFFKDSFLFSTFRLLSSTRAGYKRMTGLEVSYFGILPEAGELYIVHGEKRPYSYPSYIAVLDKAGNYVCPPLPHTDIIAFNGHDSILTTARGIYQLSNGVAIAMTDVPKGNLTGAFRWQGRLYYCTRSERRHKDYSGMQSPYYSEPTDPGHNTLRICDADGNPKGKWATHSLANEVPDNLLPPGMIGFWAADTTGLLTALSPEGDVLLPGLAGKYKQVDAWGSWMHVVDTARKGRIVDADNNDLLLPGINISRVRHPQGRWQNGGREYPRDGRLVVIEAWVGQAAWGLFFADCHGTMYTTLAATNKKKKSTTRRKL